MYIYLKYWFSKGLNLIFLKKEHFIPHIPDKIISQFRLFITSPIFSTVEVSLPSYSIEKTNVIIHV